MLPRIRPLIRYFLPVSLLSAAFLLAVTGAILPVHAEGPAPTPTPIRANLSEDAPVPGPNIVTPYVQSNDLRFEVLSLEQGLSQNTVHCILQDSRGLMWFGTWDGLNRYDGVHFTVYKNDRDDPHSLSDNAVRTIYEDTAGVLWVGTGGGLNKFNRHTQTFTRYQYQPDNPNSISSNAIRAIQQDEAGILWIGTDDGGLNRFDPQAETFTRYRYEPDNPAGLSSNSIKTLYRDQAGFIWIGTGNGGLNRLDPQTQTFTHYRHNANTAGSLSLGSILAITEDRAGALWVGTGNGLDRFDRQSGQFTHFRYSPNNPTGLSGNVVWAVFADQTGSVWAGTDEGGLNRFDPQTETFSHYRHLPGNPNSLNNDSIRAIYSDQSGALWVGTNGGGINKTNPRSKPFIHYRHASNDSGVADNQRVFPIYEDSTGILWIGSAQDGLGKFNRQTGEFKSYRHQINNPNSLSYDRVWAILQDRAGFLWLGTGDGLNRFDPRTETFTAYRHNAANSNSLSANVVFALCEDTAGYLWIGASGGGLNRLNPQTEEFVHYQLMANPGVVSDDRIQTIIQDRAGNLWIGANSGLNRFNPQTQTFTRYRQDPANPNSPGNNFVLSLYEDKTGLLWIGTNGGGFDRFDPATQTFTHYTEKNGLPNNVVHGILEDAEGNLWLSTNKGLARFNPRTQTFQNYDVEDGLQNNEFNSGSYFKNSGGEMFFGGVNGFNVFNPAEIVANPYVPPVVLTAFTQSGEPVALNAAVEDVRAITLLWPNNFFEFEFSVLNYIQPEKNQYAYKLEGFDANWNILGANKRFGRYTNLPWGTYSLKLKGSNNDGLWNETAATVTITIVPPFWQTWWFKGLMALALIAAGVGGYRWRVTSIESRNRELEAQVRERTYEIERRRQVAEGLREIMVILNSNRSLEESLSYIVTQAVGLTTAQKAIVFQCGPENPLTVIAEDEKDNFPAVALQPETAAWFNRTLVKGQTLVVPDFARYQAQHPQLALPNLEPFQAVLGFPLITQAEQFGGLVLFYPQPRSFTEETLQLGATFADQASLAIANAQLRDQVEQTAVETERNRLARDLHDAVTQTLFSASLIAEALPTIWEVDQREGRELLSEMRRLSRGALAEMRTLLLELRPTVLVEAKLGDLLRQLTEAVTGRKNIAATVTIENHCPLPSDVHVALYRIAQEALNNVVKHANAHQVTIVLRDFDEPLAGQNRKNIELQVADDGVGFDPAHIPPDHLGLGIIRERAQAIQAELTIQSEPGQGTKIKVIWYQKD